MSEDFSSINPAHYKENLFDRELIDVMQDLFTTEQVQGFCMMNAFKYRMRAGKKTDSPELDIEKALWYENKLETLKKLPF